jgi:serine/threonine-protein kinase RsbW
MTASPGGWSTEITIPSERGAGTSFLSDLLDHLHANSWPDGEVFGIHLAIEEAVVNAIRHGNKFATDKTVKIRCILSQDKLWIEIEDQGAGFNPLAVPDCTSDERIEVPSGRGVMLMKAFMNCVEFNEQGNRVRMEKIRGLAVPQEDEVE